MSRLGFPSFTHELWVIWIFGQTEFKAQLRWMEEGKYLRGVGRAVPELQSFAFHTAYVRLFSIDIQAIYVQDANPSVQRNGIIRSHIFPPSHNPSGRVVNDRCTLFIIVQMCRVPT